MRVLTEAGSQAYSCMFTKELFPDRGPTDRNAELSGKLCVTHGVDRLQLRRKVDDSRTCMRSFFWNDCCERPAARQFS